MERMMWRGKGREGREEEGREGKRRGGWKPEGGEGGMKGREKEGVEGSWSPTSTCLRHAPTSIAAAEKRPLSYQTLQSVDMVRNCSAQTLPVTMHYGSKKLGEIGEEMVRF